MHNRFTVLCHSVQFAAIQIFIHLVLVYDVRVCSRMCVTYNQQYSAWCCNGLKVSNHGWLNKNENRFVSIFLLLLSKHTLWTTVSVRHPTVYRFYDLNKFVVDGDLGAIIIDFSSRLINQHSNNNNNNKNSNSLVNKFIICIMRLISHTLAMIKLSIFGIPYNYMLNIFRFWYLYPHRSKWFFFFFFGCCRQQFKRWWRQRKRICSIILKEFELSIECGDIS